MKMISYIYKTGTLARHGKFVLVAPVVIFLSGVIFIPDIAPPKDNRQLLQIDGKHFKYNDPFEIDHFFESIKNNKGYLCLGTSESGSADYGNYYNFLNHDTAVTPRFSILSGAGRTCGVYVPVFLQHRASLKNLKVIYFINPIYWNEDLCEFKKVYWDRYSSYGMCENTDWSEPENKAYGNDVELYYDKLTRIEKLNQTIEYRLRAYRKRFFSDLKYALRPEAYNKSQTWISPQKDLGAFQKFGQPDTENIDTVWNIRHTFQNKEWFRPINRQESYRYHELASFVRLCKNLGIQCTYIIGPYNERFIRHYQPESLDAYKGVTLRLKDELIQENVDYIDASDISSAPGVFIDLMHHSSYGGYLIYQKIKQHVHEKENH